MGVQVDETGRDRHASGVDRVGALQRMSTDLGDPALPNTHVGGDRLGPGSIDQNAAVDDDVELTHGRAPPWSGVGSAGWERAAVTTAAVARATTSSPGPGPGAPMAARQSGASAAKAASRPSKSRT